MGVREGFPEVGAFEPGYCRVSMSLPGENDREKSFETQGKQEKASVIFWGFPSALFLLTRFQFFYDTRTRNQIIL